LVIACIRAPDAVQPPSRCIARRTLYNDALMLLLENAVVRIGDIISRKNLASTLLNEKSATAEFAFSARILRVRLHTQSRVDVRAAKKSDCILVCASS
jgi:hypothetical protein